MRDARRDRIKKRACDSDRWRNWREEASLLETGTALQVRSGCGDSNGCRASGRNAKEGPRGQAGTSPRRRKGSLVVLEGPVVLCELDLVLRGWSTACQRGCLWRARTIAASLEDSPPRRRPTVRTPQRSGARHCSVLSIGAGSASDQNSLGALDRGTTQTYLQGAIAARRGSSRQTGPATTFPSGYLRRRSGVG